MIYVAIGGMTLVTLVTVGCSFVIFRRLDAPPTVIPPAPHHPDVRLELIVPLEARVRELERTGDDLLLAVSEGIKNVERAEKRVQATIRRARTELEEGGVSTGALEAEHAEFFPGYADGSDQGELSIVPPAVEPDRPSSIPGITAEQLARARGYR